MSSEIAFISLSFWLDLLNKGTPDNPPSYLWYLDSFNRVLSVVVFVAINPEKIELSTILIICFMLSSFSSGEILRKIGLVFCNSLESCDIAVNSIFKLSTEWSSLKFLVLGEEILTTI